MTTSHRFSPVDILRRAGRAPSIAAAAAVAGLFAAPAAGQPQPSKPAEARPQPSNRGADDKPKVTVSDHQTVDLHVKDEDLLTVLDLLSIQTQRNIVASKSVGGKISATLYGVTFYEALDSILHVNGYGYIEQGNFIYVYTVEELEALQKALNKRVAKAIRLNYLNAKDATEFVKPLLSKDGGEIKTSMEATPFQMSDTLPVGKDDYTLGATLVVIDYEDNIKAIESLIKELDTRPAQVLVEATILQTSLNENNAFGVDFSIIGDVKFSDFINTGGPLSVANSLVKGGAGGAGAGLSPSDNKGAALTSNPGNTEGPSTFKIGVIANDVSVFLKVLDEVADTTILANPKVLTLNRMPARVLVGRRVGYLSTTSTDTSTTQSVQFLDTGTQLYVRPFVSSEGEIRMELKPQVSEAIIREATDAAGKGVSIPDEVTQGVTANVMVRDGQTIVLGGLFRESTQFGKRQVPFLGDIPLIGAAFRGHTDNTQRSEIIFLIKPTIVNDSVLKDAAGRAVSDIERLRAGSRQGLLPWSREKMTAALNVEAERFARDGEYDKAMWDIQRSLSLNPLQPDPIRLRDHITGEREVWPDASLLNRFFDDELSKRTEQKTPANPPKFQAPWGAVEVPREPLPAPRRGAGSSATPRPSDTAPTPAQTRPEPRTTALPPTPLIPEDESLVQSASMSPDLANLLTALEDTDLAADAVKSMLPNIRARVAELQQRNGNTPPMLGDNDHRGWGPLLTSGLLRFPPVNFWVGGPDADVVVLGIGPDKTFQTDHGWVFNPSTGELWAAGFDAAGNPLAKPGHASNTGTLRGAPGASTPPAEYQWSANGMLTSMRALLNHQTDGADGVADVDTENPDK